MAAGLVSVSDPIKDRPQRTRSANSRPPGLPIIMVTGDNQLRPLKAVADKLGIAFEADVLPEQQGRSGQGTPAGRARSLPWPATA